MSWLQDILPQLTILFPMSLYHLIIIRWLLRVSFLGDSRWVESVQGALPDTWLILAFNLLSLWLLCGHLCQTVVPVLGIVPALAEVNLTYSQFPLSLLSSSHSWREIPSSTWQKYTPEKTWNHCTHAQSYIPSLYRYIFSRGNRIPICVHSGSLAFESSQASEDWRTVNRPCIVMCSWWASKPAQLEFRITCKMYLCFILITTTTRLVNEYCNLV